MYQQNNETNKHRVMMFSGGSDPDFHCSAHVSSLLWAFLPAPWSHLPNAGETIIISKRCFCSRLIPTSPLRKPTQFAPHISGVSFHDLPLKKKSRIEHIGGNQLKHQDSAMVCLKSQEEWGKDVTRRAVRTPPILTENRFTVRCAP